MPSYAAAVYPVPNRYIDLGKEPAGQPGTVAAATFTFPMTTFKPVDKYTYLPDAAWRNAMGDLYNLIQGVRVAELSMGGPFFADGVGYPLTNIFGDYYQAVNSGTTSATTSLSVAGTIGATSVVVVAATGISVNEVISIGTVGSTAEEVRRVTAVNGTTPGTLTLNAALYQAHGTGAPGTVLAYTTYTNITHNWALLNNGLGAGGWTASQPPTYTWYDFSGVPAGSGTRQYAYTCFSELTLTSEATALIMWEGKATAVASTISGSQPAVTLSPVAPQAAWRSTVTLGGSSTLNVTEWKATFTRKLSPKFTNSNQQDPYAIPRGYLSAGLGFNFDPAADEQEFQYYLNNTQPTCVLNATNGLSGTAAATLTITANQVGFETAELNDSKDIFGFDATAKLIDNTTNVGPSGGFGPCIVGITNSVINY